MITGIYLLRNKINNKICIGQSVNIKHRMSEYKSIENGCKDHYRPIEKAIRKYGWKNFEYLIIEECKKEELNDKEIYWIEKYDATDRKIGYNISVGGNVFANIYQGKNNPFYGKKHTDETKQKLSKRAKERFKTKENHPLFGKQHKKETIEKLKKINRDYKKVPVLQIDIKTEKIIKEWPSARDAALTLFGNKKKSNGICVCCRNYSHPTSRKTAFGFKWKYKTLCES